MASLLVASPLLGNAGSLDQSATARKRLKTPVTPAAAQRPDSIATDRWPISPANPCEPTHHFAVAHHRAADADYR